MSQPQAQTERRQLPHDIPSWIDPSQEVYFITVCCRPRHANQLCHLDVAERLFETVRNRNERRLWLAHIFLLMPDHVHALVSFPLSSTSVNKVISQWKAWTARFVGIHWQRDFFEHRLRGDEAGRQKADYIMANPVRAGLVSRAEDWPFIWFRR